MKQAVVTFRTVRNAGLGILILILAVVGLVPTLIILTISEHEARLSQEMEELKEVFSLNESLRDALFSFDESIRNFETDFSPVISQLETIIESTQGLEKMLQQLMEDEDELEQVRKLIREIRLFKSAIYNYSREVAHDPASDTASQLEQLVQENKKKTSILFFDFLNDIQRELKTAHSQIYRIIKTGQRGSLAGLAAGVIASLLVAFFMGRFLSRPIERLVQGTERVSQGDLDFRIEVPGSDEFSRLAASFNGMTQKLKAFVEQERGIKHELEQTNLALEHSSQAKSDFLANMSHELRTPLNHIIGFSELLVDQHLGPLNETQAEYLNDVLSSGRHLLSLINDILDISKVEAGKMELDLSCVNLDHLFPASLAMVKEKATKHGIQVTLHTEAVPETIWADERKLKQVMFNLLSNAVKFTPVQGMIHVRADIIDSQWLNKNVPEPFREDLGPTLEKNNGSYLKVSVADNGIGIRPEFLTKIFGAFQQEGVYLTKKYEGTGLGLALCKKFLELHQGGIWVESEIEKGSTFTFVIPSLEPLDDFQGSPGEDLMSKNI